MTHNTDKVGFPQIPLRQGMVLELAAQNPTTDAEVAGVSATRWSIYGSTESAGTLEPEIPLYSPSELEA